jgi:hypothetical protein
MILRSNFEWDQADLGDDFQQLNHGLVTLLAWNPDRSPRPIGTAFIVGAFGEYAIAVTAAHNFSGIKDAQQPRKRHHPTALPEFIGDFQEIDLHRTRVRAVAFDLKGVEVARILWMVQNNKTDVALCCLVPQESGTTFFEGRFALTDRPVFIGDEVCALGFAEMAVTLERRPSRGEETFTMQSQPLLRLGRVTALHPEGHLLCRGPCVETSIPVFSGMSGGPVFHLPSLGGPMLPFGLISSDLELDGVQKNNRGVRGASIVALLGTQLVRDAGSADAYLAINDAYFQRAEEDF